MAESEREWEEAGGTTWAEEWSLDYGVPYWRNTVTGESVWTLPPGATVVRAADALGEMDVLARGSGGDADVSREEVEEDGLSDALRAAGWRRTWDDTYATPFYVNETLGIAQWELPVADAEPAGEVAGGEEQVAPEPPAVQLSPAPLPTAVPWRAAAQSEVSTPVTPARQPVASLHADVDVGAQVDAGAAAAATLTAAYQSDALSPIAPSAYALSSPRTTDFALPGPAAEASPMRASAGTAQWQAVEESTSDPTQRAPPAPATPATASSPLRATVSAHTPTPASTTVTVASPTLQPRTPTSDGERAPVLPAAVAVDPLAGCCITLPRGGANDGKPFAPEEFAALLRHFEVVDTEHTGSVGILDLKRFAAARGSILSDTQAAALIAAKDASRTGRLSMADFLASLRRPLPLEQRWFQALMFKYFAQPGTGGHVLTRARLAAALAGAGVSMPAHMMERVCAACPNAEVPYTVWLRMWQAPA